MTDINELYPAIILGSTNFIAIVYINNKAPNTALAIPTIDAIRNGLTENAVKPFNHRFINFPNVYPEVPSSLAL